jgi:hypothetical protein
MSPVSEKAPVTADTQVPDMVASVDTQVWAMVASVDTQVLALAVPV